jgi:hypothetical protein
MKLHMPRRVGRHLAATLGVATLFLAATASPAFADTSQATANAATLSLNGGTLLTTGTCSVGNTGAPQVAQTCSQTPSLLPFQSAIAVGALAQAAVARPDGTSAACAGLVGSVGIIQIGSAGDCTTLNNPSGGVTINLGGLATLHADAILAQCVASSTGGSATAIVTFVNGTLTLLSPIGSPPIPLNSTPAPNTPVVNLGALLTVTLNKQPVPQAAGQVMATALDVTVLGLVPGAPPLVHLTVGTVTCGPNAITAAVNVVPLKGMPLAALVAVMALGSAWVLRRRHAARV